MKEIISEEILRQQGCYSLVRQYIKGWYPEEGKLTFGYTGQETIIIKDKITPQTIYEVKPEN